MRRRLLYLLMMFCSVHLMACASTGGDSATGERFRGRLVAMSGLGGGNAASIDLHAHRYASVDEINALTKILIEGGEKALHKAVTDIEPMGWFRIGPNTRYHLRLIESVPTQNGRIIRGITDRTITFKEIINSNRSRNYSFGIVELHLDANDEGAGGIIAAAQISFENTTITIESFGNQPYRVMSVKPERLY